MICKEMQKLRDTLDKMNVAWWDQSQVFMTDHYICRTKFDHKGSTVSVINGLGTYGGYSYNGDTNRGLLEMMYMGEIKPCLTAKEVIQEVFGDELSRHRER